uniref:Uncharacterized protein n=1 Tax=Leersia perrieri TaxID=77586 RepID=A0A0D9VA66_9ORYZ
MAIWLMAYNERDHQRLPGKHVPACLCWPTCTPTLRTGETGNTSINLNYAMFRLGTTVRNSNNGLTYTNLFNAMVDDVHIRHAT